MNVTWEINAVSLIAIVAHFLGVAIFIVRASDRSIRAEKKADDALALGYLNKDRLAELGHLQRAVEKAVECAAECKEKIILLSGGFAAFRETVAQSYVTKADARDFEDRVEKAIDKQAHRIERAIERRGPVREDHA